MDPGNIFVSGLHQLYRSHWIFWCAEMNEQIFLCLTNKLIWRTGMFYCGVDHIFSNSEVVMLSNGNSSWIPCCLHACKNLRVCNVYWQSAATHSPIPAAEGRVTDTPAHRQPAANVSHDHPRSYCSLHLLRVLSFYTVIYTVAHNGHSLQFIAVTSTKLRVTSTLSAVL